jgi:type IV pilus assembly protein PilY1
MRSTAGERHLIRCAPQHPGALQGYGNLWKFDLSSGTAANWRIDTEDPNDNSGNTPIPLFTAVDAQNNPQPITAAPRASTHPYGGSYVIIGTGKFFEYPDQTNSDMQSMYGLWVRPGDKAPILMSGLQKFGWSETVQGPQTVRTLTGRAIQLAVQRGWSVDLVANNQNAAGERVVADPSVGRGVYNGLVQPTSTSDPCAGGGLRSYASRWISDRTHHRGEDQRRDRCDHGRRNSAAPMQLTNSLSSAETQQALQNPRFTRRGTARIQSTRLT